MVLPLQVGREKVLQYVILLYTYIGRCNGILIIKEKTTLTNICNKLHRQNMSNMEKIGSISTIHSDWVGSGAKPL